MARIAGIGSRELTHEQLGICHTLGQWIVKCGHSLYSGGAHGADYAFASGANSVDSRRVHLMLPWGSYNAGQITRENALTTVGDLDPTEYQFYLRIARENHPKFDYLSQGAQKLHLRNGMILFPPSGNNPRPVDLVLAWPSAKVGGGGTGQGMRVAEKLGIRLVNLARCTREDLARLGDEIQEMK